MTKRFWASWNEPVDHHEDSRPLKWPLPACIPFYWKSGFGDGYHTLCAIVEALHPREVEEFVKGAGWKPASWRFIEEKPADWMPPSDRFPVPVWTVTPVN